MIDKELSSSLEDSSLYSPVEEPSTEYLALNKLGFSEAVRRSDVSIRQAWTDGSFRSKSAIIEATNMFDLSYVKSPSMTRSNKPKISRPSSMRSMISDMQPDTEEKKIKLSKPKKQKIKWKKISMKWQISILILGLFLAITILEQFLIHNSAN